MSKTTKIPLMEKKAVCGIDYCPLAHEYRLFSEAQEHISDLSSGEQRTLRLITYKTWCKGHAILHLSPLFDRCRSTLDRVFLPSPTVPHLVTSLQKELSLLESNESHRLDVEIPF